MEEDPRDPVIFTIARLICGERLRTARLQVTVLFPAYRTQELFVSVAKLMEEAHREMGCYLCQRRKEKVVIPPWLPKLPLGIKISFPSSNSFGQIEGHG